MIQSEALEILKMGQNVFLTGPAGSGKTYLLNEYIEYLRKHKVSVAITASTGIAATHMDGRTIHSWSAINIKKTLTKKEMDVLFYNEKIRGRIKTAKVLIIDEISMLDADRLNLVDEVCRKLRRSPSPFGGLQIILCGDFFQLPPVPTRGETKPEFAFASAAWQKSGIVICYLEEQHRQNQDDTRFIEVLNSIRNNKVTEATESILMERHHQSIKGITKPTKLYAKNKKVNAINDFELAKIKEDPHEFLMTSDGDQKLIRELKKSCTAPEKLILKKGALVMFVKNNFDVGYVNGTLGTIVGFDKDDGYPIVEKCNGQKIITSPASWTVEEDEVVLARISQIPLRLAWAITIHKSQGMSLDCAEIDLSGAFTEGMGYVALSRVRSLDGIKLIGLNKMALEVSPIITEFDKPLKESSEKTRSELQAMSSDKKSKIKESFRLR